jgi:23S rRNA (guanosine2251-2'-O)-methyltransferase
VEVEERVSWEVVWGRNPVLALLADQARAVDEVALMPAARGPLAEIAERARRAGVKVSLRTRDQLTAIAGNPDHQGVVARVAAAEYAELDSLLAIPAARGDAALFVALDQVQDPRNLGAVLRAADAFGVHGVIVPKHRAAGLTGAAARTAMGALGSIPVARETNVVTALERLKEAGVWVYGAVVGDGVRAWDADLTGPLCLVLGSEGEGLRPLVARSCDVRVTIPMGGRVGSLNVASATAVLLYEVTRQRAARHESP